MELKHFLILQDLSITHDPTASLSGLRLKIEYSLPPYVMFRLLKSGQSDAGEANGYQRLIQTYELQIASSTDVLLLKSDTKYLKQFAMRSIAIGGVQRERQGKILISINKELSAEEAAVLAVRMTVVGGPGDGASYMLGVASVSGKELSVKSPITTPFGASTSLTVEVWLGEHGQISNTGHFHLQL